MLRLIRKHEIIEDIIDDWDCTCANKIVHDEAEWEIGKFKNFEDIENYLVKNHDYDNFDWYDRFKIVGFLEEAGYVNLPVNRSTEYLEDGETQVRFVIVKE